MARVRLRRDRAGRFLPRAHGGRRNDPAPGKRRRRRGNAPDPGKRRRRRHNPGLPSPRGMVNMATGAAGDAAQLLVFEAATGYVPGLIKQDKTSTMGMVIQGVSGVVLAIVAQQLRLPLVNPRLVAAAGFVGVGRGLVRRFNVPFLTTGLSAYPAVEQMAAYPQLEAYPSQQVDIYGTSLSGMGDAYQDYLQYRQ